MTASNDLKPWKVWLIGALCCSPLATLFLGCTGLIITNSESFAVIPFVGVYAITPILMIFLLIRVSRKKELETASKVFWSLGLLFFPIFAAPYYWYKFHWEPYRARQLYSGF